MSEFKITDLDEVIKNPGSSLVQMLAIQLKRTMQKLDVLENTVLKSASEYFMYGPDCGFERHSSQEEAIKSANEMIDDYRNDASDGWCDEVEQVCFGVILSYATPHDVQPPSEDNYFMGSVDYRIDIPEIPRGRVILNALRSEDLLNLPGEVGAGDMLCLLSLQGSPQECAAEGANWMLDEIKRINGTS